MTYRRSVFGTSGGFGALDPASGPQSPPVDMVLVPSPQQSMALNYGFVGAIVGVFVSWAIIWRKYPQATRGVYGASMVLPVLGVAAGQWFALRKVT